MPRIKNRLCLLVTIAGFLSVGVVSAGEGEDAGLESGPFSMPRITHPGSGQIFYFLLTDRFANGDPSNDRGNLPGGPDDHGYDPSRVSHYHGGDFVGLKERLDYLKGLGVTAVWVTPPFRNKPVQSGTAAYHGYWILDFLEIDPHLGGNEAFRAFVEEAHAKGLKVYIDIITNHTADVIGFKGGKFDYIPKEKAPYRDCDGVPFFASDYAWNGLGDPVDFPSLCASRSFPYVPHVSPTEVEAKNPGWLNDVTLYHNRGNTTFRGENSVHGDFVGLDDLFTEHPKVVQGFIDIYTYWMEAYGVDGFRIDTVKHVNAEFWEAFSPAIRQKALELGRPCFVQFGEVATDTGGARFLSEFSTGIPIDTTLDFGFFGAAREWISKQGDSGDLAAFFESDDYYTDHDSNVHVTTTFLGNHDAGRFAHFLIKDNPEADLETIGDLVQLGHGLMMFARGQPVLYYGDEQGMIGRGGEDMQARESMFGSRAPDFRDAVLLGTRRTGAMDKYDPAHPYYRRVAEIAGLRTSHPALSSGAMIPRLTGVPEIFAFSRIERSELVEYLAVFNHDREEYREVEVPTSQGGGVVFAPLYASKRMGGMTSLATMADGSVQLTIPPLSFGLWRCESSLGPVEGEMGLRFSGVNAIRPWLFGTYEMDGHEFTERRPITVDVENSGGFGEVTFWLERNERPGQREWLGTDDTPPYRIFWAPPPDLVSGDLLTFVIVADDMRGRKAELTMRGVSLAGGSSIGGIFGSQIPRLLEAPVIRQDPVRGVWLLEAEAEGTEPFEVEWMCNGEPVGGMHALSLECGPTQVKPGDEWRVLIRNRSGTVVSDPIRVP